MTAAAIHGFEVQASPEIIHHWGWFLVFGIGLLLLGITAVMRSVTATIVSIVFFGWLLVLASGIEIAQCRHGQASSSICSPRFCSGLRVC